MAARMTCVFDHDARKIGANPFHLETPFGKPVVVSIGDECARADALEAGLAGAYERCAQLAETMAAYWPGDNLACVARRSEATRIAAAIRSLKDCPLNARGEGDSDGV